MSADTCHTRNYDYYRRFFKLPINYYHQSAYYSSINKDNYYSKPDNQVLLDIKGRRSTLCFLSQNQMKTNSLMGQSGSKLTKQQKWTLLAKGGKLCDQ